MRDDTRAAHRGSGEMIFQAEEASSITALRQRTSLVCLREKKRASGAGEL